MSKISYAILTHNEGEYVEQLLNFLVINKRVCDEIIVVDDFSSDTRTLDILKHFALTNDIHIYQHALNGNFSAQKNFLSSKCSGDYIFQIDADEMVSTDFIDFLPDLLDQNPDNEVYLVPRINIVDGLTDDHVKKWGWNVNEKGYVNFPDFQWRIYKNNPSIKWVNIVHEKLTGFTTYAFLPAEEEYCLFHRKCITRQEMQNEFYDKL